MRRAIKRISPPTFKGEPGERPEAHLLRALDWFNAIGIVTDKDMLRNFRHTLDGNAREMVCRSLGQGEANPDVGRAYQLLLPVLFYPGMIPHPSS